VVVQIAQRELGAAEGEDESGKKSGRTALSPAPCQEECADPGQREMYDVKQRIGQVNRKQNNEERVGIKEQKVGVLEQGLPVVQIRVPVGQCAVAAHFLDEAGRRIGVIENVTEKKHGRRKDYLPKHSQYAQCEDSRKRPIEAVELRPDLYAEV
jgi:hypothetical protein